MLYRITGDGILGAMVVTSDGELLGTSKNSSSSTADRATLVTDVALDYIRLGNELNEQRLEYLEIDTTDATVGVASAGPECFVIAIASPDVPAGLLRARVTACAAHVEGSLIPLTEDTP
jgi:predicted regulator of Ras-like GTPase activity (Roadblock/LC7/MglB family)